MLVHPQIFHIIPIELRGTGQVGAAEIGPQRAAATLASADAAWNPWWRISLAHQNPVIERGI